MGWRNAFRLDLRRALLAICGGASLLAATYFIAIHKPAGKIVLRGFGHETRVGSILILPLEGDSCREIAFDNDRGTMSEGNPVSCENALMRWEMTKPKKSSHVEAVSENFRK